MIADLGGIMGLYLGLSIVALFEFLEMIVDIIKLFLPCSTNNNNRDSKNGYQPPTEMTPTTDA